MELASCHPYEAKNLEMAPGFFLKICVPLPYDISDMLVPWYGTKVAGVKLREELPSATTAAPSYNSAVGMKFA